MKPDDDTDDGTQRFLDRFGFTPASDLPERDDQDERAEPVAERVGRGEQYGDDPDDRPAHVAPPEEEQADE